MKALVVYDSVYGNTEKIAQAIGQALAAYSDVQILRAGDVKPEQLAGLALLIVGSPTQKFRPIAAVNRFLKTIPQDALQGVQVAAFDTRFPPNKIEKNRILAFFVKIFGYAAQPIANKLQKKGGKLAALPTGFYVDDTEGPLLADELERAAQWAGQIIL